jgi:hypothetical protein
LFLSVNQASKSSGELLICMFQKMLTGMQACGAHTNRQAPAVTSTGVLLEHVSHEAVVTEVWC